MAYSQRCSLPTPLTPSMPLSGSITEQIESLPITPPEISEPFYDHNFVADSKTIKKALHVLATERLALSHLEDLYSNSAELQAFLLQAIRQIIQSETRHGKTIFTGVGKSGHIAKKLVATFVSLGIHAVFLHPIEALHGDLGVVRPNDTVIMVTFSGKTPELLSLIPHIDPSIPLIVMSGHLSEQSCVILRHPTRANSRNILIPTVIHESETASFGVSAPTTSTTITLAIGDSLALAVADDLHSAAGLQTPAIFAANHPGGAIGQQAGAHMSKPGHQHTSTATTAAAAAAAAAVAGGVGVGAGTSDPMAIAQLGPALDPEPRMSDIATIVSHIPIATPRPGYKDLMCFDVLLAAVRSPKGFVRTSPHHMIGPRRIQNLPSTEVGVADLTDAFGGVVIEKTDWISVLGSTTVDECRRWIHQMRNEGCGRGREFLRRGTLLGIVDGNNEVTGIVEIEEMMGEEF
ncbi:hypothetical protein PV08_05838 [Exophiala spinifera]|uniref:SIS domain-containing protein n=1 Tax=Exophiala spinifera TaxID=91928 RepID=A0A0D2B9W2_9EURO|nr:uncharacterized protein PV08_05838 [Exophiala spinifera]KIW15788.1 hypothetical protein PV08_05838 [Exophiala spinifera]